MSAINIKDMVEIVENHKLQVIPVDLRVEDLSVIHENLEKLISGKTKILILAQLFGIVVD